ncbi:SMI1/KNR4 family protein [Jeotgalibacillus sp. R-1-5s-1]|uniref:SMI1/KNR4 family protein n=1 Tax=Jeotgalibacillus sp. R-1-5s-1 TaxID=2555897 RepID=UPI00106D0BE8|nr:SMI1/KNR4 family protein [Jeotgalibacillus sp. R-1-5s-1]TFD96627.1 SMI1/KNR4 family protein [Jeotgalibacillus sp. R-1-5s-1]
MTNLFRTGDDPSELEPLNDEMIAHAERTLGVTLPEAYKQTMRVQNGGYLEKNLHPFQWNGETDVLVIDYLMGISKSSSEGILLSHYLIEEWGLPTGLVILSTQGSTGITLDYRDIQPSDEPPVIYYDVDAGEEQVLAKSFADFLTQLYNDHQNG